MAVRKRPRRRLKQREPQEERRPIQYVEDAFNRLLALSRSPEPSDKLLSFNILVLLLLVTFASTRQFIRGDSIYEPGSWIILILALALSAIVCTFIYGKILELITNVARDQIGLLRIGLIILVLGLTIATAGLFLEVLVLAQISLAFIAIHLLFMIFGAFLTFPMAISAINYRTEQGNLRNILGEFAIVAGILSFIMDVVLIIVGVAQNGD